MLYIYDIPNPHENKRLNRESKKLHLVKNKTVRVQQHTHILHLHGHTAQSYSLCYSCTCTPSHNDPLDIL
jgi:hypothetical protein